MQLAARSRPDFARKSLLAALFVVGAAHSLSFACRNSLSSAMTELELHRSAAVLDVSCEVTLPGCQLALVLRNAPRRWSVRPNGGVIEAGASVRVVATYVGDVCGVAAAGGFGDDRHLILSVPLLPHQAEKLAALRRDGGPWRNMPELDKDNPRVSQCRLTPRVVGGRAPHASDSAPSPAAVDRSRSVMERVSLLHQRYSGEGRPTLNGGTSTSPPASAEPAARRRLSSSPPPSDPSLWEATEAFARGVLGDSAVDWVVYLADEMDPWLKWKVYDILFAVAALLAGRMLARRAVSHYRPELE